MNNSDCFAIVKANDEIIADLLVICNCAGLNDSLTTLGDERIMLLPATVLDEPVALFVTITMMSPSSALRPAKRQESQSRRERPFID